MKAAPVFLIFLLLPFFPVAEASPGVLGNVTVVNASGTGLSNLSYVPTGGNMSENITSGQKNNETMSYESKGSDPSTKGDSSVMSIIEGSIDNAITGFIVNLCDNFLNGVGGAKSGQLNNSSNYTGDQIAIFAVAAHSMDPANDTATQGAVNQCKQVYGWGMFFCGLCLTIFLLFQQVDPKHSSKMVGVVNGGKPGYVATDEMIEYFLTVCGWLVLGPAVIYGAIWLNNYITQSLMLSVLDHVEFSSSNVGMYVFFTVLWVFMMGFFAFRLVMILVAVRVWYIFGLLLALKKFRWIGSAVIPWVLVIIFAQFAIVWASVTVVSYNATGALDWCSSTFLYLGLFLFDCLLVIIFMFWPIIWKLLSPKTFNVAWTLVRHI